MANPFTDLSPEEISVKLQENGNLIRSFNNKIADAVASGDNSKILDLREALNELETEKFQLEESLSSFAQKCTSRDSDLSWMKENIDPCKTYINSEAYAYWKTVIEKEFTLDPCGKSTVAGISKAIQEVFARLKEAKKFYNEFVDPALNAASGLASTISNAVELISGIMRILIQRARDFFIGIIREQLETFFEETLPELASNIKNVALKQIIDTLFCRIGDVIKGLGKLVGDFLFALIGNIVKFPFCAAEQFANALINNIANRIDKALEPILEGIMSAIGGISKVATSIMSAIDVILGFENFLCSKGPECPEIKTRKAIWWGGPQQEAADRFQNFLNGLNLSDGETSDLLNRFDKWVGDFPLFGTNFNEFDGNLGDFPELAECSDLLGGRCGPPKVQIFGGGGFGAAGDVIVNRFGQVIGVNLTSRGNGYKYPPYVAFIDDCGNGSNADGFANITDDVLDTDIDPVTFGPVGDPDGNLPSGVANPGGPGGDIDEDGRCVYYGEVYHVFNNDIDQDLELNVSSDFSAFSGGKAMPDKTIITPELSSLAENKKHYQIKFDAPYDDDDYEVIIRNVAQRAAHGGSGGVFAPIMDGDKPMIKNKTRFGFSVWFGRDAARRMRQKPVAGPVEVSTASNTQGTLFTKEGNDYFMYTGGLPEDQGGESFDVRFMFNWDDDPDNAGVAVRSIRIPGLPGGDLVASRNDQVEKGSEIYVATVGPARKYGPIIFDTDSRTPDPQVVDAGPAPDQRQQRINFFDRDGRDANGQFTALNVVDDRVQNQIINTGQPILYEPEIYLEYAPEGSFFSTYVRSFVVETRGNSATCVPGQEVSTIVINNPGSGYLPAAEGFVPDISQDDSDIAIREYVGCLTDIDVVSTGLGYGPDDEITITPNIENLQVRVQINELGQIVNMEVEEKVCGLDVLPTIEINSPTGSGFKARPRVVFTPKEQFNSEEVGLDPAQIIQVIDCVL